VKFGTAIHYTGGLLDCVHIDIWGSTKNASLRGHQYFVSFVDDCSRYCLSMIVLSIIGYTLFDKDLKS